MEALGVNIINILIYIILFVALFLILKRFLLKPLDKALTERKKTIDEGLEKAAKADQIVADSEAVSTKKIQEADGKVAEIVSGTKKTASEEAKVIIEKAQQEAKDIISKAHQSVKLEKENMEKEYDKRVAIKAKELVIKVLGKDAGKYDEKMFKELAK